MTGVPPSPPDDRGLESVLDIQAGEFYRMVMNTLRDGGVDFLVGGAFAFARYTGIYRMTKDFDVFVRRADSRRALDVLAAAGFQTDLTFPHWLGKAYKGEDFVDLIYGSGNGTAPVDDGWFEHAVEAELLGVPIRLVPAEEMIWQKAFIMERERYDGADVMHLMRARAEQLDWRRLVDRFAAQYRILLVNLLLFGFVYPGERTRVPGWAMEELLGRLDRDLDHDSAVDRLCQGTIMSREQFLIDVERWGYADGRVERGNMTEEEVADWTAAIEKSKQGRRATDPFESDRRA